MLRCEKVMHGVKCPKCPVACLSTPSILNKQNRRRNYFKIHRLSAEKCQREEHSDHFRGAICSKARMQQCGPPSGWQESEGRGVVENRGYIWGVSLIKSATLSPAAYRGGKWVEARVTSV